ncbi:MAG: glycosyltransferase family 2 protein [Bacteroidetes bacterium]|nr:glycosyltransferase family 2 protein [Bacteroidota bacterium]
MRVSGFTIVRNAVKFDYPVVESILSILPLCDEVVVAVGNSEDGTRALVESIGSPKIRILDTVWDDSLRRGGEVLAVETNKALDAISPDSTWAVYIQADEVLHDGSYGKLTEAMTKWEHHPEVEGFVVDYLHFYGSYDFIADSRKWYRKEVRIIRNDREIRSYKDAQGFRKAGRKLHVKPTGAMLCHYGWVKPPEFIRSKLQYFHTLWHDEAWMEKNKAEIESFDYSGIDSLALFTGTHPSAIQHRISGKNWKFDFDPTKKRFPLQKRMLYWFEKKTGIQIGEYKNYKIVK